MNKIYLSTVLLMSVILFPPPARADSIATLNVSASFILSPINSGFVTFGSGPSLFVTGQFTLDENTSTISSWNMSFLGPLGATFQLSAQNGGVASAFCELDVPCPTTPSFGDWIFTFSNSSASVQVDTLPGSTTPFFTGETLQLCPVTTTIYPGNVIVEFPFCSITGHASFDGVTGNLFALPIGPASGGGPINGTISSGTLTVTSVASTPEPSESATLLFALAIMFGCIVRAKPPGRRTLSVSGGGVA